MSPLRLRPDDVDDAEDVHADDADIDELARQQARRYQLSYFLPHGLYIVLTMQLMLKTSSNDLMLHFLCNVPIDAHSDADEFVQLSEILTFIFLL